MKRSLIAPRGIRPDEAGHYLGLELRKLLKSTTTAVPAAPADLAKS